ncbi:MAG: molybdopterin synthase catalytic subunit, partial [Marinobacter psychrophilus]
MPQKSSACSQTVPSVSIQNADFDAAQEYSQLRDSGAGTGAIATFTGLVRDSGDRQ